MNSLVAKEKPLIGELMDRAGPLTESRTKDGTLVGMTDEMIKKVAPAVFGRQHSSLSEAYAFVKTGTIVQQLRHLGFAVQSVKQTNPRKRDAATVRHAVTMCLADDLGEGGMAKIGRPTLMLLNSNNGRSKLRWLFGFFKFACSNGLIIGEITASAALIHRAGEMAQLGGLINDLFERQMKALAVIDRWSAIDLTKGLQHQLAMEMARLRFGDGYAKYDLDSALAVRRPEDMGDNLWLVFNRLQEAYSRGGVMFTGKAGDVRASRAIDGVVADTGFNLAAWAAAERIAQKMIGVDGVASVN